MTGYRDQFPQFGRLDGSSSTYISSRAMQYAEWYDKKAAKAKRNFVASRVVIALGAILTPFFASHTVPVKIYEVSFDLMLVLVSTTSLLIAALVALEGVLKFQEQWKNYRSTEQYVVTQIYMFGYGVEEYAQMSESDGFKLFVKNVETAIKNENEVTLNVLTRVSGSEQSASPLPKESLS